MTRSHHRWRLATAWAVVVALFFHVTVLLVPMPAHSAEGVGNDVVLCSSFGMYSLPLASLDGDQVPDRIPSNTDHAPACTFFCPICAVGAIVGTPIPSADTIRPAGETGLGSVDLERATHPLDSIRIADNGPRAPPSIV